MSSNDDKSTPDVDHANEREEAAHVFLRVRDSREALLEHARGRLGWQQLTATQHQRAEQLFAAAESPELDIITTNNLVLQNRLGWSTGQAQRMVSALKKARLLSVQRRWETLPNGQKRELGPAAWVYSRTDDARPSQIPKLRKKRTDARLRLLESQVAVLNTELQAIRKRLLKHESDIRAVSPGSPA
jgi:hypothetical protein